MSAGVMSAANPIGLNGVEFIEYAGPKAEDLVSLFERWGFKKVGKQTGKDIHLYRQNDINFILNNEPQTFASAFVKGHGPSICATGFRVADAAKAFEVAVSRGAKPYEGSEAERGATPFPAIYGIGESLVYFVDDRNREKLYSEIFSVKPADEMPRGVGFLQVDHFTNNVPKGEMDKWCQFYERVFNFRETRFFDIRGTKTGLISKVMRSPCGLFSVPINEPSDGKSQIQEYLDEYKGSGIQHLAMLTDDIVKCLENLKSSNIEFLTPPPDTYYKMLPERVPNIRENLDVLKKHAVLVDGDDEGYLLQIFSKNLWSYLF